LIVHSNEASWFPRSLRISPEAGLR
jgi:hypothetical protein